MSETKTDNICTLIHLASLSLWPIVSLLGFNLPIRCQINPHSPFPCASMIYILEPQVSQRMPSLTVIPFIKTATSILTCTVYTCTVIDRPFRIELELSHRHELKIQALTGIYDCCEQVEVKYQAEMWGRSAFFCCCYEPQAIVQLDSTTLSKAWA